MQFSKKIIVITVFCFSTMAMANEKLVDIVESYLNAYASKDVSAIYKSSTKKHITFLKKGKITKILKKDKFEKFNKTLYTFKFTNSEIVKGSYQVKMTDRHKETQTFQIKKVKGKYLIDKVLQQDSHDHH